MRRVGRVTGGCGQHERFIRATLAGEVDSVVLRTTVDGAARVERSQ